MKKCLIFLIMLVYLFSVGGCGSKDSKPNAEPSSKNVTVLMYHHFKEDTNNYTVVSGERFREHLLTFKNAGYECITLYQLLGFWEGKEDLPEKPLLITMDDGYTSNLTIAAPILEELSMSATVFVIGVNEGRSETTLSGRPLYSKRFSYEEAQPWIDRGVLEFQSHTYDLHERAADGFSDREGVLALNGEDIAHHQEVLSEDCKKFREARKGKLSTELFAFAYPFGFHTPEIDRFLESEFRITFTTSEHTNVVTQGDLASLRMLGRFNASGELSGAELLKRASKN